MTLLTEFTKEMLLRSTYGDERAAIELARIGVEIYRHFTSSAICVSRCESLMRIISEFEDFK